MNRRTPTRPRRLGITLIYVTIALTVVTGLATIAVDFARVQLVKTEMQRVADSAARYGAAGLRNVLGTTSGATGNAIASAAENTVEGESFTLTPADVELGTWNATTRTFTSAPAATATAVRVTARRTRARGNPVSLLFGQLFRATSAEVTASAVATLTAATEQTLTIPATSNPFLAGATAGTVASWPNPHNNPDFADGTTTSYYNGQNNAVNSNRWCSPEAADGIPISAGKTMTFDGINGGATNDFNDPSRYSADGNQSWIANNTNGSERGIADIYAPGNSLIGVFLDAGVPGGTPPPSLDMSTTAARNFATLQPQVRQLFFIGDGRRDNGEVQQFVVPTGATRLFIGTWDSFEWNNNIGSFQVTLHNGGTISLVK